MRWPAINFLNGTSPCAARNAAQAITGQTGNPPAGEIVFRTRPLRQVTLAKRHHRLALELSIIDNGPGRRRTAPAVHGWGQHVVPSIHHSLDLEPWFRGSL